MNILPALFLFSAGASPLSANIDPIWPEGNEQISPGVFARSSTAGDIRSLRITQEISQLYHTFQSIPKAGPGVSLAENRCFAIYIRTQNGLPEFIEQIFVKDEQCTNK